MSTTLKRTMSGHFPRIKHRMDMEALRSRMHTALGSLADHVIRPGKQAVAAARAYNLRAPSGSSEDGFESDSPRMDRGPPSACGTPTTTNAPASAISGAAGVKGQQGANPSRCISMASISSDGSSESHVVEQEDIAALTHDVRAFKEALGKLRRLFQPDRGSLQEPLRSAAHERLSDVLRILRSVLEKYPALHAQELLLAAGTLIQQVKGFSYEEEKADPKDVFEPIDQLALAFSSRVSEYLMGDLDATVSVSSRTKSCENLAASDAESLPDLREGRDSRSIGSLLSPEQADEALHHTEQGVELALRRAKLWAKYARDILSFAERRAHLELEFSKGVAKLALTVRPILKEESFQPLQSIYCTALDHDLENSNSSQATWSLLQGYKFMEPLAARRIEHERCRKQLKERWQREVKRVQEAVAAMRKARNLYMQRWGEWEKAKEATARSEVSAEAAGGAEASAKVDKKRRLEEEALQKLGEAEGAYRTWVSEANDRHSQMKRTKLEVLKQIRELMMQGDQTLKSVTANYFHLQHTLVAPQPVQTLQESSRLYEPGSQYLEFVRRLPPSSPSKDSPKAPFAFEPVSDSSPSVTDRKANGSLEVCEIPRGPPTPSALPSLIHHQPKAWSPSTTSGATTTTNTTTTGGSDTDSLSSSQSNKSRDTSPSTSPMMPARRLQQAQSASAVGAAAVASSGDELEVEADGDALPLPLPLSMSTSPHQSSILSKAAVTHTFRKLKTPSRCRECDSYVYFQGAECTECGLACHKKCLASLAIQCGHKRLPRKMTTFGVDLAQHLSETAASVPPLVAKCVAEIDCRGLQIKGIYRVSGVKSKVEKLCQAFENGADLVDLTDVHPNVVANVLKLYVRQLPEPLLTYRLYPEFIRMAKEFPSRHNPEVGDLRELVKRLPRAHLVTLGYIMRHLHRVASESDTNNMPASNLGIVFGPTLLRTAEGNASFSSLEDTVHQTRVVEMLVYNAQEVFGALEAQLALAPVVIHPKVEDFTHSKTSFLRSISVLERKRQCKDLDLSSSERRKSDVPDEISLPGYLGDLPSTPDNQSVDDILGLVSDEDIPDFLLEDPKKSPMIPRRTSPTKIFKGTLKDYHGLEGFSTPEPDNPHLKLRKCMSDNTVQPSPQQPKPPASPGLHEEEEEEEVAKDPRKLAKSLSETVVMLGPKGGREHKVLTATKEGHMTLTPPVPPPRANRQDDHRVTIQVPGRKPPPASSRSTFYSELDVVSREGFSGSGDGDGGGCSGGSGGGSDSVDSSVVGGSVSKTKRSTTAQMQSPILNPRDEANRCEEEGEEDEEHPRGITRMVRTSERSVVTRRLAEDRTPRFV